MDDYEESGAYKDRPKGSSKVSEGALCAVLFWVGGTLTGEDQVSTYIGLGLISIGVVWAISLAVRSWGSWRLRPIHVVVLAVVAYLVAMAVFEGRM